jgi:hypothetical protein
VLVYRKRGFVSLVRCQAIFLVNKMTTESPRGKTNPALSALLRYGYTMLAAESHKAFLLYGPLWANSNPIAIG